VGSRSDRAPLMFFDLAAALAFLGICYGAGGWFGVILGFVVLLNVLAKA